LREEKSRSSDDGEKSMNEAVGGMHSVPVVTALGDGHAADRKQSGYVSASCGAEAGIGLKSDPDGLGPAAYRLSRLWRTGDGGVKVE
jgi:hypothetical protein